MDTILICSILGNVVLFIYILFRESYIFRLREIVVRLMPAQNLSKMMMFFSASHRKACLYVGQLRMALTFAFYKSSFSNQSEFISYLKEKTSLDEKALNEQLPCLTGYWIKENERKIEQLCNELRSEL